MHNTIGVISAKQEERNTININKGWHPSIKSARQKKTQVNTTQRKKNIRERPYAKRTHNYEMTINDNKEDLNKRVVICQVQKGIGVLVHNNTNHPNHNNRIK